MGWYDPFSRNCRPKMDRLSLRLLVPTIRLRSSRDRDNFWWTLIFCFFTRFFICSSSSFFLFMMSSVVRFLTKRRLPCSSRICPLSSIVTFSSGSPGSSFTTFYSVFSASSLVILPSARRAFFLFSSSSCFL